MEESIINRLVRLTKAGGFKQKELCDYIGISQPVFVNWKRRGTNPDAESLYKAAEFLKVSVEYLINGEDNHTDELDNYVELLHKDKRYRVLLDSSRKLDKDALDQLIAFIDSINPQ